MEDKLRFNTPDGDVLYDALRFAEWVDTNCVRNGEHKWTYRGDNFCTNYSTENLYRIYHNDR